MSNNQKNLCHSQPITKPKFAFRNRNFTLMWSGQLVSTIGTALTSLAASIYVYRVTGSALSVGLMLMATLLLARRLFRPGSPSGVSGA